MGKKAILSSIDKTEAKLNTKSFYHQKNV